MKQYSHWLLVALLLALPLAAEDDRQSLTASADASSSANASEWRDDLTSARIASHASGRLILVDLYADWCGWCKALEQKVFAMPRFQSYAEERFVLLRVDTMDRGEGAQLKARYGVETLPTTLLLDGNMVEIGRLKGFAPLDGFIAELNATIARYRELLAMFEYHRDSDDSEVLETLATEMLGRQDGRRAAHLLTRLIELGGLSEEKRSDLERRRQKALGLAQAAIRAQETFNPAGEASDESS